MIVLKRFSVRNLKNTLKLSQNVILALSILLHLYLKGHFEPLDNVFYSFNMLMSFLAENDTERS